jgi:phenylacetate-CoA ligase
VLALISTHWHGVDQRKPLGPPFRWLGPVAVGFERCTKGREIDEIFEYCARRKPTYLQCGPTQLTSLAQYAIEHKRTGWRPEIALTLGSLVTDEMREIAMEGLGAKIVDRYSSEETGYIVLQCPKHNHFHVINAVMHFEIVDENDKPCPVGTPGRVLLTSMQSYAMPLIRYEIGDMAEWGEPCDCGINLPVIKKLWGRTRHLITTPDGKRTYARIYAREFDDIEGLLASRFVLHQNKVVDAQLKVKEPSPAIAASVTEKVQRALSYPYPIQIRYVDQIDRGSSWKQDYFGVSDHPPPPAVS